MNDGAKEKQIARLEDEMEKQRALQAQLVQINNCLNVSLEHFFYFKEQAEPMRQGTPIMQHIMRHEESLKAYNSHLRDCQTRGSVELLETMPNPVYFWSMYHATLNALLRELAFHDPLATHEKGWIDDFLSNVPSPKYIHTCYRGVNLKDCPDLEPKLTEGALWYDSAFTSASILPEKAINAAISTKDQRIAPCPVLFTIKNLTGVYVKEWVHTSHKDEEIVLFRTGVWFRISEVCNGELVLSNGWRVPCKYVTMEEIVKDRGVA